MTLYNQNSACKFYFLNRGTRPISDELFYLITLVTFYGEYKLRCSSLSNVLHSLTAPCLSSPLILTYLQLCVLNARIRRYMYP